MAVSRSDAAPVIGVCAVRERARWAFWDQTAHLVADTYVRAVHETGALAVLLPVGERPPTELLDRVDALLAIGGADVDPATYGAEPATDIEAIYPERDAFEVGLIRAALERGLPFLGICRGMQVLNVALGGTLIQHLSGPDGTNPHRRVIGTFEGVDNVIDLEPGSLVAQAVGEEVHTAPCHHHQAVGELGESLRVTGRAQIDGVIEAIEHTGVPWALGVQWHPEATEKRQLFGAFAQAARS
jgi:putative glutamine amidotransferase